MGFYSKNMDWFDAYFWRKDQMWIELEKKVPSMWINL